MKKNKIIRTIVAIIGAIAAIITNYSFFVGKTTLKDNLDFLKKYITIKNKETSPSIIKNIAEKETEENKEVVKPENDKHFEDTLDYEYHHPITKEEEKDLIKVIK